MTAWYDQEVENHTTGSTHHGRASLAVTECEEEGNRARGRRRIPEVDIIDIDEVMTILCQAEESGIAALVLELVVETHGTVAAILKTAGVISGTAMPKPVITGPMIEKDKIKEAPLLIQSATKDSEIEDSAPDQGRKDLIVDEKIEIR